MSFLLNNNNSKMLLTTKTLTKPGGSRGGAPSPPGTGRTWTDGIRCRLRAQHCHKQHHEFKAPIGLAAEYVELARAEVG